MNDTITVLQYARVSLVTSQTKPLVPNTTVTFFHQIVNTGNGKDSFVITATNPLNWDVTIVPTTTGELEPGFTYPVTVKVSVPADAALDEINHIMVRATSVLSPTVYDEIMDVVGVSFAPEGGVAIFLPMVQVQR